MKFEIFNMQRSEVFFETISIKTKIGYGLGLVLSYIINALLFSYSLMFYQNVVQLGKSSTGIICGVGYIVTGISSPIAGWLSDLEIDIWFCTKYGRRKVMRKMRCHHIILDLLVLKY